jgi:hypothetical protein
MNKWRIQISPYFSDRRDMFTPDRERVFRKLLIEQMPEEAENIHGSTIQHLKDLYPLQYVHGPRAELVETHMNTMLNRVTTDNVLQFRQDLESLLRVPTVEQQELDYLNHVLRANFLDEHSLDTSDLLQEIEDLILEHARVKVDYLTLAVPRLVRMDMLYPWLPDTPTYTEFKKKIDQFAAHWF